jgi:hypothetical protein
MSKATRKFMTAMLGSAWVLAAAGNASARDGVVNPIVQKVQVESRDGRVLVRLTIDNQSDRTIYVPRTVASDKQLFGNWFEVRDSSNGDPLDYIGPALQHAPAGKDDFLAVKPRSTHHNIIDITHAYAFMQGRHAYQLNFAGNYVADVKKIGQLTPVEPDSVMFAYVGK